VKHAKFGGANWVGRSGDFGSQMWDSYEASRPLLSTRSRHAHALQLGAARFPPDFLDSTNRATRLCLGYEVAGVRRGADWQLDPPGRIEVPLNFDCVWSIGRCGWRDDQSCVEPKVLVCY